jgi:hypothetical protein
MQAIVIASWLSRLNLKILISSLIFMLLAFAADTFFESALMPVEQAMPIRQTLTPSIALVGQRERR